MPFLRRWAQRFGSSTTSAGTTSPNLASRGSASTQARSASSSASPAPSSAARCRAWRFSSSSSPWSMGSKA
eukprot:2536189-Pyramimonas_sp.AAC.1